MVAHPPFIVTGTPGAGKAPVGNPPAWTDVATQAELDPALNMAHEGWSGILFPPHIGSDSSRTLQANAGWFARGYTVKSLTVTAIVFYVASAATANDSVDVGIFSVSAGNLVRVASSGSTAGLLNSIGRKSVAVSAALSAGTVYYAGVSCGALGGTAATLYGFGAASGADGLTGSSVPNVMGVWLAAGCFPLPATVTAPGPGPGGFPRLFVEGS